MNELEYNKKIKELNAELSASENNLRKLYAEAKVVETRNKKLEKQIMDLHYKSFDTLVGKYFRDVYKLYYYKVVKHSHDLITYIEVNSRGLYITTGKEPYSQFNSEKVLIDKEEFDEVLNRFHRQLEEYERI